MVFQQAAYNDSNTDQFYLVAMEVKEGWQSGISELNS